MVQTKRIFLASSSELSEDRREFEIQIGRRSRDWMPMGVELRMEKWENFLDVMSRDGLQKEYNRVVGECDLFVMLFWTKVGKYTSEEFETAFKQFKATDKPLILTYFKTAPTSLGSDKREDLNSVWMFQDRLRALAHYQTEYENTAELVLHFFRQLDKLVANGFIRFEPSAAQHEKRPNRGPSAKGTGAIAVDGSGVVVGGNSSSINTGTQTYFQVVNNLVPQNQDSEEAQQVIAQYLRVLTTNLVSLNLGAVAATSVDQSRQMPQLPDLYIPLCTSTWIPTDTTLKQWLAHGQRSRDDAAALHNVRHVSVLEALAEHRKLTLIGKPGSGKSTFGASVLLALAHAWQGQAAELEKLGSGWRYGALFPIRVVLRHFAETLPPDEAPTRGRDLWNFIRREINDVCYGLSSDAMKYVLHMVQVHGALIVFDGLDECGDAKRCARVLFAVNEFVSNATEKTRFVLTVRPYAWPGDPNPAAGIYSLADLDDEQIERFVRAWYAAIGKYGWRSPDDAEEKVKDLLKAQQRTDLRLLACNPLLLTLMATLHASQGRLPEDRVDLYNQSVELLLSIWNQQIGADRALRDQLQLPDLKLNEVRDVLEKLAFKVHEQSVGQNGTADIAEHRLVSAFGAMFNSKDKAVAVVEYIERRAGLLLGQGEKDGERQFTFPHRTFQEFLAARHLATRPDFAAKCTELACGAPAHWREVLPLAARLVGTERGCSAADELIESLVEISSADEYTPDPGDWTCVLLAGTQLLEIGLDEIQRSPRNRAIARRVADRLVESLSIHPLHGGMRAAERAHAAKVLAQMGDPRFDPRCFHMPADSMLGFVGIPANPQFRIGTRQRDVRRVAKIIGGRVTDDELNDELTPTQPFYIARYPVTVAQFAAFVEAVDFEMEDRHVLRDLPTQPVRWVSWHAANAYCEWLNEAMLASEHCARSCVFRLMREDGWRIALPSELEWEVASRGGLSDQVYSWEGDSDPNRANHADSGINGPSVVGCFPANGFGLYDMLGNVWEWTRSVYARYPYDGSLQPGEHATMVLRGGAFDRVAQYARCAFRDGELPDLRDDYFGFRLALKQNPRKRKKSTDVNAIKKKSPVKKKRMLTRNKVRKH